MVPTLGERPPAEKPFDTDERPPCGKGSFRWPSRQGKNVSKAYITDFGGVTELVASDGTKTELERYGVWMRSARGRHEVVEVSNDLTMLLEKYGVKAEDVVPLGLKT